MAHVCPFFLVTLLYSSFVTFIKVRGSRPPVSRAGGHTGSHQPWDPEGIWEEYVAAVEAGPSRRLDMGWPSSPPRSPPKAVLAPLTPG